MYLDYKRLEDDKNEMIYVCGDCFIRLLYIANIPITFKDGKNKITIDSKINVIRKKHFPKWVECDIILGYDWLVGHSVIREALQMNLNGEVL